MLKVSDDEALTIRQMLYARRVDAAAERWSNAAANVSVRDWQAAMLASGRIPGRFFPGTTSQDETAGEPPG